MKPNTRLIVPTNVGYAVKAWSQGDATPEQQRICYSWVSKILTGAADNLQFVMPISVEEANWQQGRRWVGLQLQNIATAPWKEEAVVEVDRLPATVRRGTRRVE